MLVGRAVFTSPDVVRRITGVGGPAEKLAFSVRTVRSEGIVQVHGIQLRVDEDANVEELGPRTLSPIEQPTRSRLFAVQNVARAPFEGINNLHRES